MELRRKGAGRSGGAKWKRILGAAAATGVLAAVPLMASSTVASATTCGTGASSIKSNFNGTAIAGGNWIWFTAVLKLKSPSAVTSPVTVSFTGQTITGTSFMI